MTDTPRPTAEPTSGVPHPSGPPAPSLPRARRVLGSVLATPTPLVFVVSLGVALVLLWRQGSLVDLGDAARGADAVEVVAAGALYLVGLALLCARWHALVRMVAGRSDAPRAAEAFLTSVVVNYAAPIGLAVPTRAALTKRGLGLSVGETGAVALWEVAADVLVLAFAALAWLAAGNASVVDGVPGGGRTAALGGVLVAAVGVLAVVLGRLRPEWRARVGLAGRDALRYPGRRPAAAALALGLTLAFWLLQGVILGLLLEAVGVEAAAGLVVGLVALPVLVGMLSPVPGGAGVREALMVAVAQARGANGAAVLLAAVAYRAALFAAIPVLYLAVRGWLAVRERSPAADGDHGGARG